MNFDVKEKIILGVCAHPDDLEFCFGGSFAKWVMEGAKIYYLILTDGTKGSEDQSIDSLKLQQIRQKEQQDAIAVLGVKEVFFLNHTDGELENSLELRQQIVRVIRQVKPDIVATMDPTYVYNEDEGRVNHPDHRTAGQATLDAVYPFARNCRAFPKVLEEGLNVHMVADVLLFNGEKMNFYVDISETIEKKIKAVCQHKSQFQNLEKIENILRKIAKDCGKKSGFENAEGLVRIKIAG